MNYYTLLHALYTYLPLQRHKDESFWSFISLLILEQIVKNVNDRLLKEAHIYFISFFFFTPT